MYIIVQLSAAVKSFVRAISQLERYNDSNRISMIQTHASASLWSSYKKIHQKDKSDSTYPSVPCGCEVNALNCTCPPRKGEFRLSAIPYHTIRRLHSSCRVDSDLALSCRSYKRLFTVSMVRLDCASSTDPQHWKLLPDTRTRLLPAIVC